MSQIKINLSEDTVTAFCYTSHILDCIIFLFYIEIHIYAHTFPSGLILKIKKKFNYHMIISKSVAAQ